MTGLTKDMSITLAAQALLVSASCVCDGGVGEKGGGAVCSHFSWTVLTARW